MKAKPQGSHRGRWGSAALVVGSAVAVLASPLATGAASATTTEHFAATMTLSATPSATQPVGLAGGSPIQVHANTTDGNFTVPAGSGDVDNGSFTWVASGGPVNNENCTLAYVHTVGNYSCNFHNDNQTAGTSLVTVTYNSGSGLIPNIVETMNLTWTPLEASKLAITAGPSSVTLPDAGHNYTVTAEDQFGNTDTNFPEGICPVDVTNSDGTAGSPITLSAGVGTSSVQFTNPGTATLTATLDDGLVCGITGGPFSLTSGQKTVTVTNSAVDHFDLSLSPSSTVTAGTSVTLHITAKAVDGSTATGDNGTVTVTGCRTISFGLTNGQGSFTDTFNQSGSCNYNVSQGAATGGPIQLTVNPGPATNFLVTAPGSATAGTPVSVHIQARDNHNNLTTNYNGTVHFTSTDPSAVLPANTTVTNGDVTVPVTFETAGNRTVTASDVNTPSITGTSGTVSVSAGVATSLSVDAGSPVTAGNNDGVTVQAKDQFGNNATVSSQPLSWSATGGNNGTVNGFTGSASFNVVFSVAGTQHVHVSIGSPSLSANSNNVTVNPATASHLVVSTQSTAHRGTAIVVSVTAEDQFGNVATGDFGSLSFASNDQNAVLPANGSVSLINGTATFNVTFFRHAANDAVRVFDSHGNEGQSNPVNVI